MAAPKAIIPAQQAPSATQPSVPSPTAPAHDHVHAQMYFNRALWYAAHPGETCDKYHQTYPDRLQYLGPARDQLIKEAVTLAKNGDEKDTTEYLAGHPERKWMVKIAAMMKALVQKGSQEDIEAHCTAEPRARAFLPAAKVVFTPEQAPPLRRDSSESARDGSNSSESSGETAVSAPLPTSKGTLAASFYDIAGQFLGHREIGVDAPVHATMNITSRARRYDPRELIKGIEALAQRMVDWSQGLEGVRLTDDGLWEEVE